MTISVIDESNDPLEGVQIHNTDYTITGITDNLGNWTTPNTLQDNTVLTFTYVGYKSVSMTIVDIKNVYQHVKMTSGIGLDEVVIVGRTDQLATEMIHQVETISQKEIQQTQSQTAAEALGQNANVYIQKSQAGGGSPVVRGFEANKVLLVIDGIRMNNAIYRSGHLQNAITIDNAMLSGIEVIYGPGSLVYGSDALGGVIHFRSKNPIRNFDKNTSLRILANASLTYASANHKKGAHVDFNLGGNTWASLTSLTYNDFGDLRSGSNRPNKYPTFGQRDWYVQTTNGIDEVIENEDPDLQIGTGYKQYDITQKFSYSIDNNIELLANIQYSTSSDVPRYDALTEIADGNPRYSVWNYGPQQRFLTGLQLNYNHKNLFFDQSKLIVSHQKINEERITRRFQSINLETQDEHVDLSSITMDFDKNISTDKSLKLSYGLEYNHNKVISIATRELTTTGESFSDIFTRYPSGESTTAALGSYGLLTYNNLSGTRVQGGLRYTTNIINIRYDINDPFTWPSEFYDGLRSENQSITWSAGIKQDLPHQWSIQVLGGSAFRSPNVDDLAKIRVNNDEVSVPNLNLTPEKSINTELTISKKFAYGSISTTGFITQLNDVIVREDFTLPDGQDIIVDEGDSLAVVANVNADKARIIGFNLSSQIKLNKEWTLDGSINLIKGRQKANGSYNVPLAHIPPMYGRILIKYEKPQYNIEARYTYNGKKPIDEYGGSTDNPELATADGAYAWSILSIYSTYHYNENINLKVGIENLLDKHYRPFASGVSAAGRNLMVSLHYAIK